MKYVRGYVCLDTIHVQTPIMGCVAHAEHIDLTASGRLTIHRGFMWDGPSGRLTMHTDNFVVPSQTHDALYRLMRLGLIGPEWRDESDDLLYRMCREREMSYIRAQYVYRAVRAFGGKHIRHGDLHLIREAT